jgi:hypothetical protein
MMFWIAYYADDATGQDEEVEWLFWPPRSPGFEQLAVCHERFFLEKSPGGGYGEMPMACWGLFG